MLRDNKYSTLCVLAIGLCGTFGCMGEDQPDGVSDETANDEVDETRQNPDQSGQKESSAGAETNGDVGARVTEINRDGRKEEFWVGSNGDVWHRWESVAGSGFNSGDRSLGGHVTSGVGTAKNDDGRLEIFGRADGGDLNHKWQVTPGGDWSGWASLGGQLKIFTGVYGNNINGRIRVQVTGIDNLTHFKWQLQPNCCWDPVWR
jgi:hypothetical protein